MARSTFKATSRLVEGLQVENKVRDFTMLMDEPKSLGGTDTGMNPVEAQLAALGSCLTIVSAAFAKAHKIDLQDIRFEIEGDLDPDGFLKGAEGVRMGFQEIRFTPYIKTTSSPEDIEKFMTFVKSRCPVSDVYMNATKVIAQDPLIVS